VKGASSYSTLSSIICAGQGNIAFLPLQALKMTPVAFTVSAQLPALYLLHKPLFRPRGDPNRPVVVHQDIVEAMLAECHVSNA
jgi:hypothetical protein